MTLTIAIRSDLVQRGHTEDGDPDIHEVFYVVAENRSGRRWAHSRYFPSVLLAYYLAEKVFNHLADGNKLAEDQWTEIDPCYGSTAWQALDATGHFVERERREDREAQDNFGHR